IFLYSFWIISLLLLTLCLSDSGGVFQEPRLLVAPAGAPVALYCRHNHSNSMAMLWYRHRAGQGLEMMVYSPGPNSGNMEEGFQSWELSRTDIWTFNLSLKAAGSADSAQYLCAVSIHSPPEPRNNDWLGVSSYTR
uniref:Immunoglobulin V-set domain-containing protein n=1 Tax=Xenopus tropicalis TaxID=8364 RepID=A0A803JB09_XENTR